ncbi:hypothetical protein ACFFWD_21255 [Bradyrhizobium erythrophlei]|uniref:hypothetical protein n=1 Tax=Bradyrhizobium erythrophlei TaxID=1437360 RepID=UPI0035E906A9
MGEALWSLASRRVVDITKTAAVAKPARRDISYFNPIADEFGGTMLPIASAISCARFMVQRSSDRFLLSVMHFT